MSTTNWPGGGGGGVPTYTNLAAFPSATSSGNGALAIALDTNILYESDGTSWLAIAQPGDALSLGAFGSAPNANGLSLSAAGVLAMQPADATHPGGISTTTQSIAGNKTFTGTIAASNLSGTNTGDVTLTAVGSSPSTNAASLSGQALTLQPADATHPGVMTATTQTFAGDKIFNNKLIVQSQSNATPALEILGVSGGTHPNFFMTARDNNYLVIDNTDSTSLPMAISYNGQIGIGSTPNGSAQLDIRTTANQYCVQLFNPSSLPQDFLRAYDGSNSLMINFTATGAAVFGGSVTAVGGSLSASLNMNSHLINSVTDPVSAQDAATKAYVDAAVAALNPAAAVYAASVATVAGTYLNGVAGVGATFTTTSTSTFTLDGATPPLTSRVLFKDQSSGLQNGIYTFTTAPVGGVSGAIFTRALDYNTASDMNTAGLIPVINGTVNALSSWQQTATITTVGTDALVFQEFTANPSLYLLKANNLNDVASKSTSFNNLSPMTTGGDLIYGGASGTGTRLPNGSSGQVLTSAGTTLAPTWSNPTNQTQGLQLINVGISASVSSGTLTVALKQSDGSTDPSTGTAAAGIGIRGSTNATGNYNVRSVTAALSQTIQAGTQLSTQNYATAQYIWVYAIDSDGAGTMKLGVSSARYDDGTLVSTVTNFPTVTISQASPGVITLNGHGYNNGDQVSLKSVGGTLPTGITQDNVYFVVSKAANTFQISNSFGGGSINTSSAGSGTFHVLSADNRMVSDAVYTSMPARLIGRILGPIPSPSTGWGSSFTEVAVATPAVAASISPVGGLFGIPGRNQGSMVPQGAVPSSTIRFPFTMVSYSDGSWNDTSGTSGSQALNLSTTGVTGTLAAGRFPALTGDVTTSAASLATTLAATSNSTLTTLSGLTTAAALATVGTITSGTWNGTAISVAKGGTGFTAGANIRVSGAVSSTVANSVIVFPTTDFNNGMTYSAGRVTVPTAGFYLVGTTINGSNANIGYLLRLNTSASNYLAYSQAIGFASGSMLMQLAANDIVDLIPDGTTGAIAATGTAFFVIRQNGN